VFGIAIQVSGVHADRAEELRKRLPLTWRERWGHESDFTGFALPVVRTERVWESSDRERQLLTVLASLLKVRRDFRDRLADRERVEQLAIDLVAPGPTRAVEFNPVRRDATDISVAMRDAGLTHRFGRPLGNETYRPLDELVAEVKHRLEQNPHRAHRTNDEAQIARLIREHYLDVEPWPFAALVRD
jgi:hypothetical protein